MSQLIYSITANRELIVPVFVAASAFEINQQRATNQPVINPVPVLAQIDTGANHCSVSPAVLQSLGLRSKGPSRALMAGGAAWVEMYDISLSIVGSFSVSHPMLPIPDLEVAELLVPLNVDVLIGVDVLLQCHLHLDGPARQFTLTF